MFGQRFNGGCFASSVVLGEWYEHVSHTGSFLPGAVVNVLSFDDFLPSSGQRPIGFHISHRGLVGTNKEIPVGHIQVNAFFATPFIKQLATKRTNHYLVETEAPDAIR